MNTIELSRLMGRHLSSGDAGNLSDDAALDVLSAINSGLEDFYRLAPANLRTTEFSSTVRAPEEISLVFSGKYSGQVGSPTFESRKIGCTLRAAGSAIDNKISGPTSVLNDHLSDTLTTTGTIYSDAIAVNARLSQIVSDVMIYGATIPRGAILGRRENRRRLDSRDMESGSLQSFDYLRDPQAVGRPISYGIESLGSNQGGEASFLVRLSPMPDLDYIVRFSAELSGAKTITFAMLSDAVDIPIAATHANSILLPLCEGHLTASPFWANAQTKNRIEGRSSAAVDRLRLLPNDFAVPDNSVGTPRGY